MIKVSSSQFNYQYGDQIHFPYSIARLVAYMKTREMINQKFQFDKTFVFREKIEEYINRAKDSDILLCSCYVWNWEITTLLAKEIKKINPECLIIFGGPEVPDLTGDFFEKHPYVDIIVHGEGENIITNIFEEFLNKKDFSKIKGLETKDFRTEPEPRIKDLDSLPSPYLTNTVWDLVEDVEGVKYIASWETNRGCPYQCTFCDWGSLTNARMTKWSEEKLFKEIEWFAENKIVYIDCCDANFGIYGERDLRIAKKVKEVALKTGYPERIRPAWAKMSSDKIIPIAKELQDGGLLRAVTLAVQSLDETTLEIIKRANIKFDKFSELTETFRKNGIPTYTELIMGMPGETLETWKKGLEILVSDTKIGSIFIYNCGVFTNAPMNQPIYVKHHKIKKLRSPIFLAHSSVHDQGIPEYEEISVGTASFSLDDLKEIYLYSWLVQGFSSLGIFEHISKYYNKTYNLKFMEFFEVFLEYCRTKKSLFSEEYEKVMKYIDDGYSGKGWNHHDPMLGEIYWPIEEATWLRITYDRKLLLKETTNFLNFLEDKKGFNTGNEILGDLVKFQMYLLTTRDDEREIKSDIFEFNWKDFFVNNTKLIKSQNNYSYKNLVLEKDSIMWGFKTIFYGRTSKKYKFHPELLQFDKSEIMQTV